jgi:hypothetical protein
MSELAAMIALVSVTTLAVVIAAVAALKGWEGWLEVRRLEIERGQPRATQSRAARPDLSELKARVRRLEAIANGSDS